MPKADAKQVRVMRRIIKHLDSKREKDAVRLFVSGADRGLLPAKSDHPQELSRLIGKRRAVQLIRAFAFHPCYACTNGLEPCDQCQSERGTTRRIRTCERCLDLGVARCDFCDGAGWVAYSFVPEPLRLPVIVERIRTASRDLKEVMSQRLPKVDAKPAKQLGRALEKHLLHLNRLAGIMENALLAAKKHAEAHRQSAKFALRIMHTCLANWDILKLRISQLIKLQSRVLRLQLEDLRPGMARTVLEDRARFYDMLSRSKAFEGTGLVHPFLTGLN